MHNCRKITEDLCWVGGNDRRLALFENIHPLSRGVSYNAYVLLDEKTVLLDTADWSVGRQFLENVRAALKGRPLDYLVIHHVEPDHAAALEEVLLRWPEVRIITSAKAAAMLRQFGFPLEGDRVEEVKDGDRRSFGRHTLTFLAAPMVHWPEVMMSFDETDGALFSADAFGTFGALDGKLFADEFDFPGEWLGEARRYYTNIVGKYGIQVQTVLKKAAGLDIRLLCPLHGPVWRREIGWFLDKYAHLAAWEPEEKGVVVVYASMYGNTENAAELLTAMLARQGITNTRLYDVSSTSLSELIAQIFRYSHLVLAGVTYNFDLFPPMRALLEDMKHLGLQKRTCAVVESGSWAIRSGALARQALGEMKDMTILEGGVTVTSSVKEGELAGLEALAEQLAASLRA